MMIRPLVFAAYRYRHAYNAGKIPTGSEWWWPSETLTRAITSQARISFERDNRDTRQKKKRKGE
jgi:hypothetical protein